MNRWRKTLLTSLAVVAAGAITLGAGTVMGGSAGLSGDVVKAAMPPHADDHHGPGGDLRVLHLGGGSWLGVRLEEVGGKEAHGARVTRVEEESPAARAGIREGDVILSFGGVRILGTRTLTRVVRETPAGRIVELEIDRDGRTLAVEVELEERAHGSQAWSWRDGEGFEFELPGMDIRIPRVFRFAGGGPLLGVAVDELNSQLAGFLGLERRDGGLFITQVFEDTPAERGGLKAGDVLLEADGRKIGDTGDLREVLRENRGRTIPLQVFREGSEMRIDVTLEEPDREWEDGRSRLREEERREIQRALREAQRARREAMREYRQQMREMERLRRERGLRPVPAGAGASSPVEI